MSSDRTRKRLAGLAFDDRSGAEAGLYDPANSDRVYAALLERAEHVLASGRVAILDATFDRAARRAQARSWAERSGVACLLVETRCDRAQVLRQLVARQAEGRDPSDAGPERYEESVRRFEPVSVEERRRARHQLARGIPVRREDLAAAIDTIRNLQRAACAPPRSAPD